jgi:hypothetical protein
MVAARNGAQRSSSWHEGRFAGGAQWAAAVTTESRSSRPSSMAVAVGWLANPARHIARYRKSPDRSPVNIRPVRLAPWAAGARPTTSSRARPSMVPKLGTGFPQYAQSAKAARLVAAIWRQ